MAPRRLTQKASGGDIQLQEVSHPLPGPTQVIVDTRASLISGGTERATRDLAGSSLVSKARARPDLVRKVIDKARTDGVGTAWDLVRTRLSDPIPLGYSGAGVVTRVGEAVSGIRPGNRVATAGAGHGDVQVVAGNLVAPVPDSVPYEQAAFGAVAAVALNGLRLSGVGPGDRVLVVGLGLVGQLAARLARTAGAVVAAIDPIDWKRELAAAQGTPVNPADDVGWERALSATDGRGFDAVMVTAATSSSEPARRAARVVRDQGTVVVVGDVGLDLERRPLYEREVKVVVARSYGPGRYDPTYEELGVDYPYGAVRWTAGRNLAAVMDLLADGRLTVEDLITHRFPLEAAEQAYTVLEDDTQQSIGVVLTYPELSQDEVRRPLAAVPKVPSELSVGAIGAGRFARQVLFPAAREAGFGPWRLVASATGSGAERARDSTPFVAVADDPAEVIADEGASVVFVASDHASHADYVVAALKAGKHVFCEKPLAVTVDELREVEEAWKASTGCLMVGHNRRWSPAVASAKDFLAESDGPLQVVYRVKAGALPEGHWLRDRRQGGRILGEVCHFLDTAAAIVDSPARTVTTLTSGRDELLLDDDVTVTVGFSDGSQAVIVYGASAATAGGKERIEVLGRGRFVVVDDYASAVLVGPKGRRTARFRSADKGHSREMQVFAELIQGRRDSDRVTRAAIDTAALTLTAVESALTGKSVDFASVHGA